MIPAIVALLATAASLTAAQSSVAEFWWSYPPENYTETAPFGYDPAFEVCGDSCGACETGAEQCYSTSFANICYEPLAGEKCCNDVYGTACVTGYYCAWNDDDEPAAFCCASDTNTEECGNLFNETLRDIPVKEIATTIRVTDVRIVTASATTSTSIHQQKYTTRPQIPGVNEENKNEPTGNGGGLSVGAKVGIAIGAFVGAGLLAGIIAFFFMRRRRAAKYGSVDQAGTAQAPPFPAGQPGTYAPPTPAPAYASYAGAYEPMRTSEQKQEYQYMASPQPSVAAPAYHDQDHALPQQQGVQMSELPGRDDEVHELPSSDHHGSNTARQTQQ